MLDRERYALIKTFTDTLLEYKDEISTLKGRCKILEEQLKEEQLNKKGSENMLDVERKMMNSFNSVLIEKNLEIKKLKDRCKELEELLNRMGVQI